MAFVYRAERNINKISNQNTGNTFPGEYFNKSSFIKDIDRQSSEFQSGSKRDLCLSKIENTPGPGSYERNILRYEYPSHHHHKKAKSKDIYEAVKINLIPREILNFLEKKQNIGFNTRGQRFNYKYDMEKSSPGPGSYSPNGSSINGKTDYSTAIFQNNSSKKNQSNNLSNIFPTTYSDYRTETIPSKGNLGYKINKEGVTKMVKSKIKDENLIGPGTYDINLKKKENGINWSRTTDENDPKYNLIEFRKHLTPLTELELNYINNKITSNQIPKQIKNKKFEKNAIFKYQMSRRHNMINTIKEKLNTEKDLIFDAEPGPGYYAQDYIEKIHKTQIDNNKPNKIKCFQSTSPRFNIKFSNLDEKIGPGYYFGKTKPNKVTKLKQKKGHLINANEDLIENSAYKINNIKENFKIPGPGYYTNFGGVFPIKSYYSSLKNSFGITSERFKEKDLDNDDTPGPGYYDTLRDKYSRTTNSLSKINEKKKNKIFTNFKSDLINVEEMNKITKDKFDVPPIGTYNPYITSTIDYNNKSKINTFTDKTVVGFGSQAKKTRSFAPKENNKLLGPGIYYKSKEKKNKQNIVPFNQNEKRFYYDEKNRNPGPGSYETSYYEQWNKKSHNILFV